MQLFCPMCPSTKTPPVRHLTNRPLIPLLFEKWEMRKDLLNERHRMNAFMGWGLLWNTSEPFPSLALTLFFNTQKAITARFPKWQLSVSCCPKGRRDESCNLFPTSPLYLSLQIRRDGIYGTAAKWCLWISDYGLWRTTVGVQTGRDSSFSSSSTHFSLLYNAFRFYYMNINSFLKNLYMCLDLWECMCMYVYSCHSSMLLWSIKKSN